MIALATFLFAACPQDTGTHASLHPENAELFVEAPDVHALWGAFATMPMAQAVRSPEVRDALSELLGSFDVAELSRAMLGMLAPGEVGQAARESIAAASLSLTVPADGGSAPNAFGLGLVVDFDEAKAAAEARDWFAGLGKPVMFPPESPLAGTVFFEWDAVPGMLFWTAAVDQRLTVGGGAFDLAGYLARLGGEGSSLVANETFAKGRAALPAPSGTTLVRGHQRRSPLEIVGGWGQANPGARLDVPLLLPSGFDPFGGTSTWRVQITGGRLRAEGFTRAPASKETPILGGRALDAAWLDVCPPEAAFVYSTAFDGAVASRMLAGAAARDPGLRAGLDALKEALGFGVDELVTQLGPALTAYALPISGIGAPPAFAWIQLADAKAFEERLAALDDTLAAHLPGFAASTRPYRIKNKVTGDKFSFPVTSITLPPGLVEAGGQLPLSVDPAMAVVEGKLFVGLKSMHLKRELKRLYGGEEEEASAGAPLPERAGVAPPGGTRSYLVMDWGLVVEELVSTIRNLGPMLAGMMGMDLPFDPEALPPASLFLAGVRPTVHYSRALEGGTYRFHEASFGPETWLGLAAGVELVMRSLNAPAAPAAPTVAGAPVAGGPDAELRAEFERARASLTLTRARLQEVRTGIAVYRMDAGALPARIEVLLEPTADYPNGFVGSQDALHDAWGNALRYAVGGDGYRLWSAGPNGVDEDGAGDDVREATSE